VAAVENLGKEGKGGKRVSLAFNVFQGVITSESVAKLLIINQ
jgi:hypothetical protein